MKKLFILLITLTGGLASAQEKCNEFTIGGTVYKSHAYESAEGGKFKRNVYLEVVSEGTRSIRFGTDKQRYHFVNFISSTYTKYIGWEKKAIANKVKDTVKTIDQGEFGDELTSVSVEYGDLRFAEGSNKIAARMYISKNGKVYYYLNIYPRISDSNIYINTDGDTLFFSNKAEIDALLTALSTKCINEYMANESKKEELFN